MNNKNAISSYECVSVNAFLQGILHPAWFAASIQGPRRPSNCPRVIKMLDFNYCTQRKVGSIFLLPKHKIELCTLLFHNRRILNMPCVVFFFFKNTLDDLESVDKPASSRLKIRSGSFIKSFSISTFNTD